MVIMFGRRWFKLMLAATIAVTSFSGLNGCAGSPLPSDGKPLIVASMYPFAFLASSIAGDHADVTTLVPPGTEPHDYELRASQAASLQTAAVVVYQEGISAAVDQAITQAAPAHLVQTGTLTQLLPAESGDDEAAGSYAFDPHTWLDPANMIVFADAITAAISAADPVNAAAYQANDAALKTNLKTLDSQFSEGLADCQRTAFMTTHAAFGYLARHYGLTQLPIAGATPEDEPSPRRLGELAQQARSLGLTTVFFETLVSPDYANTLAADLKLRTDVLDPLEAVTKASRGSDYLQIMTANLQALRTANGCP